MLPYSKSLSLPGERIGYVRPRLRRGCRRGVRRYLRCRPYHGPRLPAHADAEGHRVLRRERPDLVAYDENRNLLYSSLREMGYECAKPDGAFYLFVKGPQRRCQRFLREGQLEHNLLVVPADGFGCPGYFRLSYCVANDMIQRSLPAFKAMIESYK